MKFLKYLLLAFIFLQNNDAVSQTNIKGRIINRKDGKPVAFATVTMNKRKLHALSDMYGNFILSLQNPKNNDSLLISSVGFNILKLSINDALTKNEFELYEEAREMQPVIIRSYLNEEAVGSKSDITGYFRTWNYRSTGGEIGRIFYIDKDDYKLERVRFKLNNQCDTCRIRLHIREVVNGIPGEEILRDSIAIRIVNRLSFDDKNSEFDLRPYELVLKNKNIFVGMEILNCSNRDSSICSVCYIGTENGNYTYKTRKNSAWGESGEYSIYLRLFYKY